MDNALIYDTFEDRLLAAIIGRAVKDYVVARTRKLIDALGNLNDPALCLGNQTYAVRPAAMLGCTRTEIRTAWQFMHDKFGLEFFLASLVPNQDPEVIRDFAEQAILGKKQVVWK
jgi:hypothetical protein